MAWMERAVGGVSPQVEVLARRQRPRWVWLLARGCVVTAVAAACSSSNGDASLTESSTAGAAAESPNAPPTEGAGATAGASDPAVEGDGAATTAPEEQDPGAVIIGADPTPAGMTGGEPLPATPSTGCGQPVSVASGPRSLEALGVARTYLLDLPADYDGATAYPIVFAFHGATTSGEFFRGRFYGNLLSTMADEAILVHPDALGDPTAWNDPNDIPFFDAMLAELRASLCVDEDRVFATGHSSGGFFTNNLGCQRGDVLRAIAPVSAGGPFGRNACTGEVAVLLAHAENDETVAFTNGVTSRDRWLDANGCSEMTASAEPDPCVEYSGCGAGLPVRWCVYQDGHNWPDFGPAAIWGFFSSL